jgi:hypothetical protein
MMSANVAAPAIPAEDLLDLQRSDDNLRREAARGHIGANHLGLEGLVGGLQAVIINTEPDLQKPAALELIRYSGLEFQEACGFDAQNLRPQSARLKRVSFCGFPHQGSGPGRCNSGVHESHQLQFRFCHIREKPKFHHKRGQVFSFGLCHGLHFLAIEPYMRAHSALSNPLHHYLLITINAFTLLRQISREML